VSRRWPLPCALAWLLLACGGGGQPAAEAPRPTDDDDDGPVERHPAVPEADDDDDDDGVEIEGLRGHLTPQQIEAGVAPHSAALSGCHTSRSKKRRYLGGQVEIAWTVARDGAVRSAQIKQSDLGSWEIERCLLDIARGMRFALPKGGEADFSVPFDFGAQQGVRWWDEERADREVAERLDALEACPDQPSNVWVTLYVGTRGQVQSAGFSSPSRQPIADSWADCAAAAVESWTLADPQGQIAKAGFRYHPE
jgi:TonB family protein